MGLGCEYGTESDQDEKPSDERERDYRGDGDVVCEVGIKLCCHLRQSFWEAVCQESRFV